MSKPCLEVWASKVSDQLASCRESSRGGGRWGSGVGVAIGEKGTGRKRCPFPRSPPAAPRVGGRSVSAARGCGERAGHRAPRIGHRASGTWAQRSPSSPGSALLPTCPPPRPRREDSQSAETGSRPRLLLPLRPWLPRRRRCPNLRRLCSPPAPTHVRAFAPQGPVPLAQPARPTRRGGPPRSSLPNGRWAESFADDLNTRRGIVSGRVALLPRSTEIQPHVARIRPSPTTPSPR